MVGEVRHCFPGAVAWQDDDTRRAETVSITIQHTKECLCIAHITALGGSAGLNFSARPVFDYGVDGDFRLVQIRDGRRAETGFSMAYQQSQRFVGWKEMDTSSMTLKPKHTTTW
jgi:hypothetical protein